MGFSTTAIPFLVIDDSSIIMESATPEFFGFTKLSDFQSISGSFYETDKEPKTFIFKEKRGFRFAEFTFK